MKIAILVLSVLAFVLVGVGFGLAQLPGGASAGLPFTLQAFIGGLVARLGSLLAFAAAVLCAVNAFGRKDWRSGVAMVVLALLGLLGGPYLQIAVAATHRDGNAGSGAPQPGLSSIAVYVILLGIPLATLLYALFMERSGLRFAAAGAMALLTLASLLVAAPPWAAFNPLNGASVLTVSAPATPADCAQGQYPKIMLKNVGGGTLNWHFADAGFGAVTVNPTSGSLNSGQTQEIAVVGNYAPPADRPHEVSIEFDSTGGNQRVTIPCQG